MTELLFLTGSRQQLLNTLDKLVKQKITREELIERTEAEVDSTSEGTPSPQKQKVKTRKVKKSATKGPKVTVARPATKDTKIAAARPATKDAKIAAAKQRVKELFQVKPYCKPYCKPLPSDSSSSSDEESECDNPTVTVAALQQELAALRKKLNTSESNSRFWLILLKWIACMHRFRCRSVSSKDAWV